MTTTKPILFHAPPSYYSMIARLVLAEKNVAFESHLIDIHLQQQQHSAFYANINPNLSVPSLEISKEKILIASDEILYYIEAHYPGACLTAENKQLMNQFIDDLYAIPIEQLTMGHTFTRHPKMLARGLGVLDKATNKCRKLASEYPELQEIFEKKVETNEKRRQSFNAENIEHTYLQAKELTEKMLNNMNHQLQTSSYLAGDEYSLADVVATVFLARIFFINEQNMISQHKELEAYFKKLSARASFKQADIWQQFQTTYPLKLIAKFFKAKMLGKTA